MGIEINPEYRVKNPYSGFSFLITFVSDTELREKCSCFKIYIESEEDNQDEKSNSENQDYTAQN